MVEQVSWASTDLFHISLDNVSLALFRVVLIPRPPASLILGRGKVSERAWSAETNKNLGISSRQCQIRLPSCTAHDLLMLFRGLMVRFHLWAYIGSCLFR
jgi:hypothetical protein